MGGRWLTWASLLVAVGSPACVAEDGAAQDTGPITFLVEGTADCAVLGCPLAEPFGVGTHADVLVQGLKPGVEHSVVSSAPDVIEVQAAAGDLNAQWVLCQPPEGCRDLPHFTAHALREGSSVIRILNDRGERARVTLEARTVAGLHVRVWRQHAGGDQERLMPDGSDPSAPYVLGTADQATLGWDLVDAADAKLIGLGGMAFASSNDTVLSVSDGLAVIVTALLPGSADLEVTTPGPLVTVPFEVRFGG
jgi:hypothetical protein